MSDIVQDIANLYKRVGSLESEQSDRTSITRIIKIYDNIGISVKFTVRKHPLLYLEEGMYPDDDLYI